MRDAEESPAAMSTDDAMQVVTIDAPCRLHFGLLSFGRTAGHNYGGLGLMISPPRLRMRIEPASVFSVSGPAADDVARGAQRWAAAERRSLPLCRIVIEAAPARHCGLGSGTQLALATAAGLRRFVGLPDVAATELAVTMQRGERSAIGTHGFDQGGLIFELGKSSDAQLAPLAQRLEFPADWRFVLLRDAQRPSVFGGAERRAFAELPPVPKETEAKLQRLATDEILPAVRGEQFERFAEHLHQYGRLAGSCFTAVQEGPFASPAIERQVGALRAAGVRGVGQSSWGPTIYAACRSQAEAEQLADELQANVSSASSCVEIAFPCNRGAALTGVSRDS